MDEAYQLALKRVTCGLGRLSHALVVWRVAILRQQAADNLQETDKLDRYTEWTHSGLVQQDRDNKRDMT